MATLDELRALLARGDFDAYARRVCGPARAEGADEAVRALLADERSAPLLWEAIERSRILERVSPELEAVLRSPLDDALKRLGEWRFAPARGALERIWCGPGLGGNEKLRTWCGHGLLGWGDRAALELLACRAEEAEGVALRLAVRGLLLLGTSEAWDRLAPHFEAGDAVAEAAFHELRWDYEEAARGQRESGHFAEREPRFLQAAVVAARGQRTPLSRAASGLVDVAPKAALADARASLPRKQSRPRRK